MVIHCHQIKVTDQSLQLELRLGLECALYSEVVANGVKLRRSVSRRATNFLLCFSNYAVYLRSTVYLCISVDCVYADRWWLVIKDGSM